MSGSVVSLQDKQIEALEVAISGNASSAADFKGDGSSTSSVMEWKILIFDTFGRDMIAPLLKVGSLRKLGVTLHLLITSEKQPIKDAPAVYFCLPTEENVLAICKDCKEDLYQSFRINFITPISRPLLERMAQELVTLPSVSQIRVFDHFMNFVSLESDLFSLQMERSYQVLHSPQSLISDKQMDAYIDSIVSGLCAVIIQMQELPVVVSVRGGAAQAVAEKLSCRLVDLLREKHLQPSPLRPRQVLLLCDRDYDIPACLTHTWSYRAMLADVLGLKLNKVELKDDENPTSGKKKTFELESHDKFWKNNAGALYHEFSDRTSEEIEKFKHQKDKVTQSSGNDDINGLTSNVSSLLSSVPQMKEQKKFVDLHTNLGYALLTEIKARSLDAYYQIETAMLNKDSWDRGKFQQLMTKEGTNLDRLRLFLIYYYFATSDLDILSSAGGGSGGTAGGGEEKEVLRWEKELKESGLDLSSLNFIKSIRAYTRTRVKQVDSSISKALLGFGAGITENLKKAKLQIEATLRSRNLYLLPLTRMVDTLLQDTPSALGSGLGASSLGGGSSGSIGGGGSGSSGSSGSGALNENLFCVDPKTGAKIDVTQYRFSNAIVFLVGGGSYVEYQNLKDWEKEQHHRKHVTYGCSELLNGEEFLSQLTFLGQHST